MRKREHARHAVGEASDSPGNGAVTALTPPASCTQSNTIEDWSFGVPLSPALSLFAARNFRLTSPSTELTPYP